MDQDTIQLLYNQNLSCYQANPYDLVTDGIIDLGDLTFFIGSSWLNDGVGLSAFAEMASVWLECYLLPTSDCL